MSEEAGVSGALDAAVQRLERAVGQLELRIGALVSEAGGAATGLFEQDRAKLAAELDAARGRERELEEAGQLASAALGRAIADIRAALGPDSEPDESAAEDGASDDHDAVSEEA